MSFEEEYKARLKIFNQHADDEKCNGCKFFPIGMPCYKGAKILNSELPDANEKEYLHRMQESHKDCEWCNE